MRLHLHLDGGSKHGCPTAQQPHMTTQLSKATMCIITHIIGDFGTADKLHIDHNNGRRENPARFACLPEHYLLHTCLRTTWLHVRI